MAAEIKISKQALRRLPLYYRCAVRCRETERQFVSSEEIAREAEVNPVQVRKDLTQLFGEFGKPGVGYNVEQLCTALEELLGFHSRNEAVLVGAGRLGSAIASYPGFAKYGLSIVALFDTDPEKIGTEISGKRVFPMSELPHIIRRLRIQVGIITVPAVQAQSVASELVQSGVRAIWNFAPVTLRVDPGIVVRNEDLAAGLATLFHHVAGSCPINLAAKG
ncbi:MAG TPA: redox-sensing transcriptional repressor Rex [Firmicutes bacterium]|nr:redox-sensing transcriptional repressor Rex [Bacillota bacterium]HHY97335.1 redox-sensing transcriptional repressor Rex [Bacillota bacterium]